MAFLPSSDFDVIETVCSNACVEYSFFKIPQEVLCGFGVHVQTSSTNVQKKILIDFLHSFQTVKAFAVYKTGILLYSFLRFKSMLSNIINTGVLVWGDPWAKGRSRKR